MCFETLCVKVHVSIDSYGLNSKSAAFQSIWLKFSRSDAIYLFYKTVSANLILLLILKLELFSTGSGDLLPSPTSFANQRKTNALAKNLRHGFLVERVEKRMRCLLFSSVYFRREWNMNYRDVYFYTKRSNFETHLSKSFLLVQIHNLELLIYGLYGFL